MNETLRLGAEIPPNPRPPLQAIQEKPDLESLFRDAADDLTRYFARRHGSGADTPQDLVQETFLEMARGIERGGQARSWRAYLFGIARHVSLAAWKRRARDREGLKVLFPESVATAPRDVRVECAREVIESLPPLQREILELRFTQQLSYAEIAEALSIPVGTVRSRLHHAIARVREHLAAEEETD